MIEGIDSEKYHVPKCVTRSPLAPSQLRMGSNVSWKPTVLLGPWVVIRAAVHHGAAAAGAFAAPPLGAGRLQGSGLSAYPVAEDTYRQRAQGLRGFGL